MRNFFISFILFTLLSCAGQNTDEISPDDFPILNKPFRHAQTYELKTDGSLVSRSTYFETNEIIRINVFDVDSTHTKYAMNPIYPVESIENVNNLYLGWKSWPHILTEEYILVDWGYENQSDTLFYKFEDKTLLIEQKLFDRANEPWVLRYSEYILDENYNDELANRN